MAETASLPDRTDILIVGAGLVGCSIAHELTASSDRDVTVVDRGRLPGADGTSSFAPSGVFQVSPGRTQSRLAQRTRDLALEHGAYVEHGSLEVAISAGYRETLRDRVEQAMAWGIEAELIDGSATADRFPALDPARVEAAVHIPSDGRVARRELLESLQASAESRGASFHGGVDVAAVTTEHGVISGIETDQGHVRADDVVLAANVWTPALAATAGVELPVGAAVHPYAVTDTLQGLSDADAGDRPWLRAPESSLYARQHGTALGIGYWGNEPELVEPSSLNASRAAANGRSIADLSPEETDRWDPSHYSGARPLSVEEFAPSLDHLAQLVPAVDGADIAAGVDGLIGVTPDGNPAIGEAPSVEGCWVAAAVPARLSGGVGSVLASLLLRDRTAVDVDPWQVARFQPHSASAAFRQVQCAETYRHATGAPQHGGIETTGRTLRESPFYRFQDELGADFYDLRYGGWKRPMRFRSNEPLLDEYDIPERDGRGPDWSAIEAVEHLAVRDRVGLSDLTSFSTFDLVGPGAVEFAQSVFSNDVEGEPGDVTYTLLLDEGGGIHGDMTVVSVGPNRLHVISNSGGAGTKQLARLRRLAPDDGSVHVVDRIGSRCGIAVAGPNARAMLDPVVEAPLDNDSFPYFSAAQTYVEEIPVLAARVSYVGELGWEFHTSMDYGAELWRTLWEAGQDHGALAYGDGALVSLRLEKGFPAYGVDIHPGVTPFEAGLEHTVDLDTAFLGRDALLAQQDEGIDRQRATLVLDDPDAVVGTGRPVLDGDERVGYLTSAGEGYFVDEFITYAYLPPRYTEVGTELQIRSGGERHTATVREPDLLDPEGERLSG